MDQVRSPVRELTEPRTGRDGRLHLAFAHRGGRTVLTERRFRTPLQVLEGIAFDGDPALGIVVLNPTGGVLGGDRLTATLRLDPGTHVVATTPSATRVYGTAGPPSRLATHAAVGAGATLEYVPDHVIPHPAARVVQDTTVDLAPDARLLLWDAWALGRAARGERWVFDSLASRVGVRRDGAPLFIDRFALTPARSGLDGVGGSEGSTYVASWLAVSGEPHDWTALADHLADLLLPLEGVDAAGSPLGAGGCVIRVLSRSAYALAETQRHLWDATRSALLGLPALDLRKG